MEPFSVFLSRVHDGFHVSHCVSYNCMGIISGVLEMTHTGLGERWFCVSLHDSTFSEAMIIAWNPWWDYLNHVKLVKIRVFVFAFLWESILISTLLPVVKKKKIILNKHWNKFNLFIAGLLKYCFQHLWILIESTKIRIVLELIWGDQYISWIINGTYSKFHISVYVITQCITIP